MARARPLRRCGPPNLAAGKRFVTAPSRTASVLALADIDVLITNGDPAAWFDDPTLLSALRVIALP